MIKFFKIYPSPFTLISSNSMTCPFSLLGILTDLEPTPRSRKMSTDALGIRSKNRGQSYVHIFLPIASRGVIALLVGTLTKLERHMLSSDDILSHHRSLPQSPERMYADASCVKYNIEHRAADPKSQSKPLSPFNLFSSWWVSSHSMVDRNIITREF